MNATAPTTEPIRFEPRADEPVRICHFDLHDDDDLDYGPSRLMAAMVVLAWLAYAAVCGVALGWLASWLWGL